MLPEIRPIGGYSGLDGAIFSVKAQKIIGAASEMRMLCRQWRHLRRACCKLPPVARRRAEPEGCC